MGRLEKEEGFGLMPCVMPGDYPRLLPLILYREDEWDCEAEPALGFARLLSRLKQR
jgi:hypothetical protein